MKLKKDEFETLRQIDIKNRNSQREMAKIWVLALEN